MSGDPIDAASVITLEDLAKAIDELDRRAAEPRPVVIYEEYSPELAADVRAGKFPPGMYVVLSLRDRIPLTEGAKQALFTRGPAPAAPFYRTLERRRTKR